MNLYEAYSTDNNLENGEGVVLDYGAAGSITIHRAGGANRKYAKVLLAKMAPYTRQAKLGTLDEEVANRVLAETYAEAVIVGWKGVKGRDGKALTFNKANVVTLLTDLPEFFRDIQEQANMVSNFRAERVETEAKNSSKS